MAQKKVFKSISNENRQAINEFLEVRKSLKKSDRTIEGDDYCLSKVVNYLGNKNFKDATEKDLQDFFKTIDTYTTYNLLGVKLIKFYNWLFKLKRRERPDIMNWFEQISKKKQDKESNPDQIKNQFITPDEYKTILDNCWDKYGMWEAMFETYYLSGGRLNEVRNMTIGDVVKNIDSITVVLRTSKTKPRKVPLPEYPDRLIRWIEHHPNRNSPDSPLWISVGARNNGNKITGNGVTGCFYRIRNNADIKDTLTIHCFRKTRAILMFNERTKDGGIKYSDTQMAMYFGWSLKTVADRKKEYDLTTYDELEKLVFEGKKQTIEDFDVVKKQKERLEGKHEKEINKLKEKIDMLSNQLVGEHDLAQKVLDLEKAFEQLA